MRLSFSIATKIISINHRLFCDIKTKNIQLTTPPPYRVTKYHNYLVVGFDEGSTCSQIRYTRLILMRTRHLDQYPLKISINHLLVYLMVQRQYEYVRVSRFFIVNFFFFQLVSTRSSIIERSFSQKNTAGRDFPFTCTYMLPLADRRIKL